MNYPKITIGMPVYNGGQYFRMALDSALSQTYNNIEIIVVNDGSTDGGETEAIAREYGSHIIYLYQKNKGVAGALNAMIPRMTGDYFAWLSHDDIHLPQKLDRQIDFLRRLGKCDAILISDYDLIDPEGNVITTVRLPHANFVKTPIRPLMHGAVNGCTLLIPAKLMRCYGPFDEALRYTQDYEMWNRMLATHDIFHQPEVLIQYRLHPGQDTHKPNAVIEGNVLWQRMLLSRNMTEQVQMYGSRHRYFISMAKFLDDSPYKKAAAFARAQLPAIIPETMVSVIIPFWNEVDLVCRAVRSVFAQTHNNIEVIVVDDGSTDSIAELEQLGHADKRLHILRQLNAGPGAARNRAMEEARGEYIAFLDADDEFLPHKIQRQMQLMQNFGAVASHTSYYVRHLDRPGELGVIRSGRSSGRLYPAIISNCNIAMPTVMLHRTIIAAGFEFPTSSEIAEDVCAWIDLSVGHDILGIDEPLSVIEWSSSSAALDINKNVLGTMNLIDAMRKSPIHSRNMQQIHELSAHIQSLVRNGKPDASAISAILLAAAFPDSEAETA